MKKVLKWDGIALLVFCVATQPQNAAAIVQSIVGGLASVATGFGQVRSRTSPRPPDHFTVLRARSRPPQLRFLSIAIVPPTRRPRQLQSGRRTS